MQPKVAAADLPKKRSHLRLCARSFVQVHLALSAGMFFICPN
jgi:hypothetical protein